MTKEEFKFALRVEMVLNRIPKPEYRQMMVEALMVLINLMENDSQSLDLRQVDIEVDKIVHEANRQFIEDLVSSLQSVSDLGPKWVRLAPDPPENCHLNVKKIDKNLTFLFLKIAKNGYFSKKI